MRFLIIGVLATVVNYVFFYVFLNVFSVHYLVSSSLGFVAGVFFGYGFNKAWSFEVADANSVYLLKYFMLYTGSLVVGMAFLKLQVAVLGVLPEIANIFTIGLTTCTNFIGLKFFVFKARLL